MRVILVSLSVCGLLFGPLAVAADEIAELSDKPVQLAAPGLNGVNGVSEEVAAFFAEHLAQQMAAHGFRVITTSEISSLIGLERQRQLITGCQDDSESCIAELAGALGVDGIITGSIGKFGASFQMNLKVLKSGDAQLLASHSERVTGEEEVLEELTRAAHAMAPMVRKRLGRRWDGVIPGARQASTLRTWSWAPLAAGALLGAGGGYFVMQAKGASDRLQGTSGPPILTLSEAQQVQQDGRQHQVVGVSLLGGAAVGLAASGVMYLFGGPAAPKATVALTPAGASFGIAGSF